MDLGPVIWDEGAIFHDVPRWHLHPAVIDHDPERRKRGPQRHHRGRKQIEPRRHAAAPKDQHAEERGLEHEGRKGLVHQERTLDRPGHFGQHAPIRAELECHHDPGYDTQAECHAKYFQPEFKKHLIDRAAGSKMKRFEDGQPRGKPDRERRENDVERDGESELKSRQEKRRHIHCNSPDRGRGQRA